MVTLSNLVNNSSNNLAKVSAAQAASLARISSGNRINQAADDVAGLAAGTALNSAVTALRSAANNTSQGSSLLQVADGAIAQQLSILDRQKALALQAGSGQLTDSQRSALNQEFQGLSDQLDQLASSTNFNGVSLLDGSASLKFTIGTDSADTIDVALSDTRSAALFNNQVVDINSQASAQSASAALDSAITNLTSSRANVGALQSRFNTAGDAISSAIQAQEAARSALLDTDIAEESTRSAAANVQQQASIATLAQNKKLSSNLLKLLG